MTARTLLNQGKRALIGGVKKTDGMQPVGALYERPFLVKSTKYVRS
jgi:hypothetical protein